MQLVLADHEWLRGLLVAGFLKSYQLMRAGKKKGTTESLYTSAIFKTREADPLNGSSALPVMKNFKTTQLGVMDTPIDDDKDNQ